MNKNYIICLKCGSVQVRTDIDEVLADKTYALVNKEILCPKCRTNSQFVATKDIKKLRVALNNSSNRTDQKILSYVRG